jgi:lantibiotic modifying enzyme
LAISTHLKERHRVGMTVKDELEVSSTDRGTWLGWAMESRSGRWVTAFRAMATNLYDGTAGIGLFLGRLALLNGDPIIRATAKAALEQALTAVDPLLAAGEYGFYSGLSGIAWACREVGLLLDSEALAERGEAALGLAAGIAPNQQRLDMINGSAGLIPVLVDAAEATGREEFLASAARHGEHLIDLAERSEQGWSWDTLSTPNERHLLGFAHGVSGVACALAQLAHVTARPDFLRATRQALCYERSYFRPAEGNWPDLRSFVQSLPNGEPPCMLAWCHGAPGIGFARLRIQQLLPAEENIFSEAETAVQTTLRGLTGGGLGNFCLCHGDGGNADMLVLAADLLRLPQLREQVEAVALSALDRFEVPRLPWPCGVPNAGETPNLLLGLAGIGYFLLRLYDSKNIPTVLLPCWRC